MLIRHGIGRDAIALLSDDLERSLKRLGNDSTGVPRQPGFHH
jgi:hypothetical protein